MSCPLCQKRKGRRLCPAKGETICAHCCGTKRRVEIQCPDDCVYLSGAHAPAWEGRETERRRDARRLAPHVQELSERQAKLLFLALSGITRLHQDRPALTDALLSQAVTALRKTVETRTRGILYDHQAEDLRAQGLVHELSSLFEATDERGQAFSPSDDDLLAVLTAVEAALDETRKEGAGVTEFLATAARLTAAYAPTPRGRAAPLIIEP
jgi:hypothetical protein